VPLSDTVCVPAPPPALTLNVAVFDPFTVGLNTTLIVQVDPIATDVPQGLVYENCPRFLPERIMLAMCSGTFPVFLTVTTMGALAWPVGWLPKLSAFRVALNVDVATDINRMRSAWCKLPPSLFTMTENFSSTCIWGALGSVRWLVGSRWSGAGVLMSRPGAGKSAECLAKKGSRVDSMERRIQRIGKMRRSFISGVILAAAISFAMPVQAQSISAVPDSGTADAGIASKAINNVTANDTVNGAPATLGASGNATVAKVGTWRTGIVFNTTTGAITTTVALAAGSYSVTYKLCDLSSPPNCASATDTVNVITPSILPMPDSGTAVSGTSSRPIANVAANDSVNGAPATLGTSGNVTVAKVGTWPTGIALTPSTGAVTTTIVVPPGIFNLQYQLCDRNTPPACGTGTATVTVAASIVALPVAGTTVAGTAATVIPNVAVNDRVNGAPATLGTSGNATVAQIGTWPTGIALNTTTGAITTTAAVLAATYSLQLQLCDKNSPPDCAAATATVTVTQQYAEVQATATPLGDLEFDWGRDGINCPTCNFGDGNARANWTDRAGNLWIAHLDPNSGQFISAGANDELADITAFFWNVYGNGPEWTFSMQNGRVVSQLVYSRWQPGQPQTLGFTGAAYATQTAFNKWSAKFLPGAIGQGNGNPGTNNSNLPEGSQCNADPVALAMFKNFASPLQMFTEPVTSVTGTAPTLTPITMSNGIGERFVPCTHQLLFQGNAPPDAQGHIFQQVWWYNMDTQAPPTQLTTDASTKYAGFMFKAPDFGDNYIFFTLVNHTTIQVYEQTGTNPDGSPAFALVNSIMSPDSNEPYMNSPEPFINCTPTCTTYVFTTLAKTSDAQNGVTEPNGLAVIALSPNTPMFNILVAANSLPPMQRLDPEYFITPNGPYLYYNRIVPQSGSTTYKNTGEWYIDMQLGTPSGPCRGSSAEGGLVPGC
jgi:hypothetical protein